MAWYIPLLIFFARLCDVPLGTMRMILTIGGHRWVAAALGFFEVIIWVLAVGTAIRHLTSPVALVAYGAGFASGVLVGMWLEDRIALGFRMVRVIYAGGDGEASLCEALRERGYRVTRVPGEGRDGPVEIAFLVIPRRRLPELRAALGALAPDAFVTVERVDRVVGGGLTGGIARTSASARSIPALIGK
jgi:uncharacterized protein YebE (UPF0316 family)